MRPGRVLFLLSAAAALISAGAPAYATTYAPNTWDCTAGNASTLCAQADLPPMPTARYDLSAVTGQDGFLYVMGGRSAIAALNTVEALKPGGAWLTAAAMPTARYALSAVTGQDGFLYVMGGETNSNVPLNAMEVYDTVHNQWGCSYFDPNCSDAQYGYSPLPTARYGMSSTLGADGRIYMIGGYGSSSAISSVVEAYNPATDIWDCSVGDTATGCNTRNLKPTPSSRLYASAVTGADGRIYVFGGLGGGVLATVESYDPTTGTWLCSVGDTGCAPSSQTLAPMPTGRYGMPAVKGPDNNIYVFGGYEASARSDKVEAYTPSSGGGTWVCSTSDAGCPVASQILKPMISGRFLHAGSLGQDHRVYLVGGDEFSALNTVEAYTVPASGGPTAAGVQRMSAVRHGAVMLVRWTLGRSQTVAGFAIYAGRVPLTSRLIPVHSAPTYHATVRWTGRTDRLSLHVVLRSGQVVRYALP